MWILQLNPMTANAEYVRPVARAETPEELMAFMERERTEPYKDGRYHKVFRKDGLLEWFNDPGDDMEPWIDVPALVDIGSANDWAQSAIDRYESMLRDIPGV